MIAEKKSNNTKFIKTIMILRALQNNGTITAKEYETMKEYFKKAYAPDISMV